MRLAVKETEAENLFETLANKSPVGLYIVQDGKFCYTNPTFQSNTGYRKDELLGRNSLELTVPEDRERVRENAVKMLKGELALPYQFRVVHNDGSIKWVMESVVSIQYRGRQATLGDFVDITERKRIEEQYKLLADYSADIIYRLRLMDERFIYVSSSVERILGYTTQEKLTLQPKDVLTQESYEKQRSQMLKDIENGVLQRTLQLKAVHRDGHIVPVELHASFICDETGQPVEIVGVVRDITERKEAEEALQAEKNKLQSLVDAMEDGLTIQDRDYNIIYEGRLQRTLFGDRLGEKCYRVYEGREKICEGCPVEKAFKDGKSHTAEGRTEIAGKVAFWENTANPIRDARGEIVSCLEIGRNITERKRQEQALADEATRRRILVDQSLDGIVILDIDAKVYEANQRFAEMLGYTPEEVRELHTWDWDKNYTHEQILEMGRGIDEKGRHLETKHTRKDGSVIDVDISISAAMFGGQKLIFCIDRDITERKKMEEKLKLLSSVTQQVSDATIITDADFNITYVNKAAQDLFGYSPEEMLGKHIGAFNAEPLPKSLEQEIEQTVSSGKLWAGTLAKKRKDGSTFLGECHITPLYDEEGKISSYIDVLRDITERKKMEEAINLQRAYFQQLFDTSPDAIIMMDTNDRAIQANRGFEVLFGYSNEEVKGRSLIELIIPEVDVQEASDSLRRISGGEVVRKESVRRRKDGSLVDVSVLAYPIRFNDKLVGTYGVYSDITERKKMEEAIKHAAEEWRRTFDSISDAISIHDRDFRILRVNRAFADMFHTEFRQLLGRHCYEIMHGTKGPVPACPHHETLQTGKPARAEFFEPNLGIYLELTTSPIFDERGEITSTVHIARDITERKRQSEQLMMADRLASIGELAAGTAHELNNPLTSVIGFSQLLMEKDIPNDIREDLGVICSEAQRAADVTKQLLKFARKHASVKQLNQINNIIEDALKLRAYEQKVHNIRVERELAPALPEIMVDYFQLQQVFLNIIVNAEYFMTEAHKRGTLTITTKKQNSTVRISFADDGPGIPQENLNRLFDPFFTTKEVGMGTGLGLSICHGIVTEHGGQIYARNQQGKGATFFVELPINGH